MAINTRLSNLYAAEDWKQVYESFKAINLTAYDFDTIRTSMLNYLMATYPDSYNDWIENDEFLFILDTLAFLGQNLAFRMDMNSREAFFDTAQRKDSVLKLANYISYSPRRNYASRGLVKIVEVKTNEDIRDSSGKQLKGVAIRWNDPLNQDWYEQFILVLNASFISTNQFGDPIKQLNMNGTKNHLYAMNTIPYDAVTNGFNTNIGGTTLDMEIVNPDIDSAGIFIEREPSPQSYRHMIYRNDGNGFSSPNTGFFMLFKQGVLGYQDFIFNDSIENRIVSLSASNINETDVWVQQSDDYGTNLGSWTKVPSFQSISYNNINRKVKKIFSVGTLADDKINIRFPDSRSGVVPVGHYRVWYRTSSGTSYTIKTSDIQEKKVQMNYRGASQTTQEKSTLTIGFSLQTQVQNSQPAETIEQIKARAPQMYYTQDRLITGEDYNIGPLALGNSVLKSKAINRTYSGHSRFIDFTDPTGKYQNTSIFSDSGAIYRDANVLVKGSETLPTTKSNETIIVDTIQPLLNNVSVIQRYQEYSANVIKIGDVQTWTPINSSNYQSNVYGNIFNASMFSNKFVVGTLLHFYNRTSGATKWTSVVNVDDDGIVLSVPISTGWALSEYIPAFRTTFTKSEIQNISTAMMKYSDFSVYYSSIDQKWNVVSGLVGNATVVVGANNFQNFLSVEFNGASWDIVAHGVQYVFTGGEKIKFFFVPTTKITDISTGTTKSDTIDVLAVNNNPSTVNYAGDINLSLYGNLLQTNGYIDGSRVMVSAGDIDQNGIPLNPYTYRELVPSYSGTDSTKYETFAIFKVNDDYSIDFVPTPSSTFTLLDSKYAYTTSDVDLVSNAYQKAAFTRNVAMRSTKIGQLMGHGTGYVVGFKYDGTYYFVKQTIGNVDTKLQSLVPNTTIGTDTSVISLETALYRAIQNSSDSSLAANKKLEYFGYEDVTNSYFVKIDARTGIKFHWKHYAPADNRIDPNKTNIIDMFVLTSEYRDSIVKWSNTTGTDPIPLPPTNVDLQSMFSEVEEKGSVSNTIIWHSAKFVPLFGKGADDDHKADFKIIKSPTTKLSDDEIKQKVIELTNNFFDPSNWEFGETFYFTELCTYIHQQMSADVASIVVVPTNAKSKFGTLFEIPCGSDELFINTATVSNVKIINTLTKNNINIG